MSPWRAGTQVLCSDELYSVNLQPDALTKEQRAFLVSQGAGLTQWHAARRRRRDSQPRSRSMEHDAIAGGGGSSSSSSSGVASSSTSSTSGGAGAVDHMTGLGVLSHASETVDPLAGRLSPVRRERRRRFSGSDVELSAIRLAELCDASDTCSDGRCSRRNSNGSVESVPRTPPARLSVVIRDQRPSNDDWSNSDCSHSDGQPDDDGDGGGEPPLRLGATARDGESADAMHQGQPPPPTSAATEADQSLVHWVDALLDHDEVSRHLEGVEQWDFDVFELDRLTDGQPLQVLVLVRETGLPALRVPCMPGVRTRARARSPPVTPLLPLCDLRIAWRPPGLMRQLHACALRVLTREYHALDRTTRAASGAVALSRYAALARRRGADPVPRRDREGVQRHPVP